MFKWLIISESTENLTGVGDNTEHVSLLKQLTLLHTSTYTNVEVLCLHIYKQDKKVKAGEYYSQTANKERQMIFVDTEVKPILMMIKERLDSYKPDGLVLGGHGLEDGTLAFSWNKKRGFLFSDLSVILPRLKIISLDMCNCLHMGNLELLRNKADYIIGSSGYHYWVSTFMNKAFYKYTTQVQYIQDISTEYTNMISDALCVSVINTEYAKAFHDLFVDNADLYDLEDPKHKSRMFPNEEMYYRYDVKRLIRYSSCSNQVKKKLMKAFDKVVVYMGDKERVLDHLNARLVSRDSEEEESGGEDENEFEEGDEPDDAYLEEEIHTVKIINGISVDWWWLKKYLN